MKDDRDRQRDSRDGLDEFCLPLSALSLIRCENASDLLNSVIEIDLNGFVGSNQSVIEVIPPCT